MRGRIHSGLVDSIVPLRYSRRRPVLLPGPLRVTIDSGRAPFSRLVRLLRPGALLITLLCAWAVSGCGQDPSDLVETSGPGNISFDTGSGPVPNPRAQAVLPASAGAVDLVARLLPPERVCAMPAQALRYSGLRDASNPHLALPTFAVYESERVLDHKPDLVLAHGWQKLDTTSRLREAGIPVVVLHDAVDWQEIRAQILEVGRLLDVEPEAELLVAGYDRRLTSLNTELTGQRRPTALCYTNGGAGGWVAGAGTTNDTALELAGLRNLAAESGRRGHVSITFEELLLLDPEIIVVGGEADAQQPGGTAELLRTAPALAELRAVREGGVLVLDSWLYTTTSHHVVDAAVEMARLAAPLRDGGS